MQFDVLTLFPQIFSGFLSESLIEKAIQRELVGVKLHNFRDWATDKHQSVDDRPYGGGPGMVLNAQPIVDCAESIGAGLGDRHEGERHEGERHEGERHEGERHEGERNQTGGEAQSPHRLILLTPQGCRWDQAAAEDFAAPSAEPADAGEASGKKNVPRVTLICGRYEGFDQRVIDLLEPEEWSLGDFVLNGGEVAAMAIMESIIRLIPGVLGDKESCVDDSFSTGNRLLEAPQYTRPREFRGLPVPEVLLSGDHQTIAKWRAEQSMERTKQRRGDLLSG